MEKVILILLAAISIIADAKHKTCERNYNNIGCFKERDPGSEDLVIFDRDHVDWNNIEAYMHSLACRCDDETRKRNTKRVSTGKDPYVGFALHYYGECYGRTAAQIKKLKGREHQKHLCVGDQSYTECIQGKHKECVGVAQAEYVYQFKVAAPADIDGGYTEWQPWTKCQSECGPGLQLRERTCTNPEPKGKGKDCEKLGDATQTKRCENKPCPVDGGFSDWGDFSECTAPCGGGTQTRTRKCDNPAPEHGGRPCDGPATESQQCNTAHCPINGGWSSWSKFDECSVRCGGGAQKRTRGCTNPAPQHGGKECEGKDTESKSCNTQHCPVDGGYTRWSGYGACSKSCGGGTQYRSRTCTNPRPAHGGNDCKRLGSAVESRPCNQHACPIKEYTRHCCEGGSLFMSCHGSERLRIRYATYGRKTRGICKHWLSWAMKTNCRAGRSTDIVANACNNRKSCRVYAKNGVFGDPCWGTTKYLQVTYRCQ